METNPNSMQEVRDLPSADSQTTATPVTGCSGVGGSSGPGRTPASPLTIQLFKRELRHWDYRYYRRNYEIKGFRFTISDDLKKEIDAFGGVAAKIMLNAVLEDGESMEIYNCQVWDIWKNSSKKGWSIRVVYQKTPREVGKTRFQRKKGWVKAERKKYREQEAARKARGQPAWMPDSMWEARQNAGQV